MPRATSTGIAAPRTVLVSRASAEKAFAAERGIAGIRVLIILLNTAVYHFLQPHAGTVPWLAYAIIGAANAYGLAVFLVQPYRRFPVMMSAHFTTVLDAGFITLWLYATGGVASPYVPLWYVSVTAVAFRYGARETLFAALLYVACYAALVAVAGQLPDHALDVIVRSAYIGFVAAVGGLLARESATQALEKQEARALAEALRDSEERLRRLNDAAFEGIAIHEDGVILECNRAFARIFGYERTSDVIGKTAFDFIAPESHPVIEAHLRTKMDDPYEVMGRRADGTRIPVEIVARDFPWPGGRNARVTAVRDITDRKQSARLAELDKLKTQFINNAAHELATPLTPIKLQSHMLRVESLGPLNEKQRKAINVVARNADHLGLLVKDVLESARVQGGNLVLRRARMDLARTAREAIESFEETARRQGVALALEGADEPLALDADEARTTQVLFNLLSNALKFTPAGGRVRVTLDARTHAGEALVRVADTGAGLRPEDVPRLFQPFSQVHDASTSDRRGTGLGLYISRGIVEAHGGRIWCESDGVGKGATFCFTMPLIA